ncbi:peptidase A24A, prepilin type IV [Pseudomonas sp. CFII64]|uniref:A24 family peptidase n=1 Tax=Pseudomonas sp. CFII64 TaxID=911242 RepID=UPI000357DF7C|nr:A24 family peptidase [Pseudomonas sp. CFII64]EPJ79675.1 peptidase A24A, prepilin type IV [Pseudomonas sp. CFII64]
MNLLSMLLWLAICAEQDARQQQVSNWLTLGAVGVALGYMGITGQTWLGAEGSEGCWALLLAVLFTLPGYMLGKLGAGDVKLFAALALATDSRFLLGTFIGAGVTSVLWISTRQKLITQMDQWVSNRYIQTNTTSSNKHPFAPHILAGFLMTAICIG